MNTEADRRLLIGCEFALVAVTASLVIGFARLFVDASFLPEIAAMGLASHGVAILCRRTGRGLLVAALVSIATLLLTTTWLFYGDTTRFGLPTWATRDAARVDLSDAWNLFGDVRAPTIVHPGFVLAAGLAIWVVAFLADWAAFRLWSPLEAVAPAAIVFLFCSLQRAEDHQALSTALFAGSVLVFVLLHRLARQDSGASWLATDPGHGRTSIMRVGSFVGAAAIVTGLVVGPALPGAGEEAVVPWRDIGSSDEDNSRVTVSPLVTIRSRLVDLANVEAFAVQTQFEDYWRLTSLDKFDGDAWTSSGRYESADGDLPSRLPDDIARTVVRQQFTILGLESLWLPAAYEPKAVVEEGGLDPSYEAESGTLTVGDDRLTADGATYVVDSRIPVRDPAAIAAAGGDIPDNIADRYLDLPGDFSDEVEDEARRVTDGATTPYQKAMLLQGYFRATDFRYSLDIPEGHGTNAIEQFLFVTRTGYCEQFAGSFAAMARAVGLPSRVAVGFTPGVRDEAGVLRVTGEQAHAWPEVYFDDIGWLRFEPTPGRGAPGDQGYTGIAPDQADGVGTGTGDPAFTPTTVPGGLGDALGDGVIPSDIPVPGLPEDLVTSPTQVAGSSEPSTVAALLPLFGALLAAALAITLAIPIAKSVRRTRRRAFLRSSARGSVDAAWEDVIDSLALLDVAADPAATPRELADRAAGAVGTETAPQLYGLAEITTLARFGPDEPDAAAQAEAAGIAHRIRVAVAHRVSWKRRLRRAFDPRPLMPRNEAVSAG